MDQTARHVIFRGRVQGVGFRYTARQIAGHYKVTGFVRNLPDGTVEMFIQGDSAEIDNCIVDIQSEFAGHVRDTQIEPAIFSAHYTDFRIVL
ncbi:MAG: acylphosphatase [Solirubrobacterales bacterium]